MITIADFQKIQMKTARVVTAERIADAQKLLALTVDLGDGDVRPLVAGIAQHYEPETLIGKTIIVLANLQPVVIRGHESRGMLLAVKDGGMLKVLTADGGGAAPGLPVG